jgi:hypothetical protein
VGSDFLGSPSLHVSIARYPALLLWCAPFVGNAAIRLSGRWRVGLSCPCLTGSGRPIPFCLPPFRYSAIGPSITICYCCQSSQRGLKSRLTTWRLLGQVVYVLCRDRSAFYRNPLNPWALIAKLIANKSTVSPSKALEENLEHPRQHPRRPLLFSPKPLLSSGRGRENRTSAVVRQRSRSGQTRPICQGRGLDQNAIWLIIYCSQDASLPRRSLISKG